MSGLKALKAFARATPQERCDLCGEPLSEVHGHLLGRQDERLLCSCRACALLFPEGAQSFRHVPPRVERLAGDLIDDATWAALDVPIGLAFFLTSSARGPVARYPGPAGAVESALQASLSQRVPLLGELSPDVEAILVRRLDETQECWRLSLDHCYRLVGILRSRWQGFSGGPEAREAMDAFFAELRGQA